ELAKIGACRAACKTVKASVRLTGYVGGFKQWSIHVDTAVAAASHGIDQRVGSNLPVETNRPAGCATVVLDDADTIDGARSGNGFALISIHVTGKIAAATGDNIVPAVARTHGDLEALNGPLRYIQTGLSKDCLVAVGDVGSDGYHGFTEVEASERA